MKTATQTTAQAHTPGPWEMIEERQDAGNGYSLHFQSVVAKGGNRILCRMPATSECVANARLIASAPELLAACKNAIDYIQPEVDIEVKDHGVGGKPAMPNTACWLHDILLSAIAKAQS